MSISCLNLGYTRSVIRLPSWMFTCAFVRDTTLSRSSPWNLCDLSRALADAH